MNLLPPPEIAKEIAVRVHDLRVQRGLRQADLALRAGVPLSTLKRFERTGRGSIDLLVRVAVALQAESTLTEIFAHRRPQSLDDILERSHKPMRVRRKR